MKTLKKKIIYIAGVGHSGSTILDMSLSCTENVVGLGEIKTLLDSATIETHLKSYCSCGKQAKECEFWKDLKDVYDSSLSITENYDAIIHLFDQKFGKDVGILDSSKNSYAYLSDLDKKYDLKVVLLTRDFRSWIYSRSKSAKTNMLKNAFLWIALNVKIRKDLKKMGLKPIIIGYEELALYPEHILKLLTKKLEIPYSDAMLTIDKSKSHIISGNIARMDPKKNKKFIYDARWLLSSKIQFLSVLLFFIHRFNKNYVYSNLYNKKDKSFYIFGNKRREDLNRKYN